MDKKIDWEKLIRRMERLLRLKSFPVAFKMLENINAVFGAEIFW